jgi:uncharacterized Fe-S radical SAM superfamily protein PflX
MHSKIFTTDLGFQVQPVMADASQSCCMPLLTSSPFVTPIKTGIAESEANTSLYEPSMDTPETSMEGNLFDSNEFLLVQRECLWKLLQTCPQCGKHCMVDAVHDIGTFVSCKRLCSSCYQESKWDSQTFVGAYAAGDISCIYTIYIHNTY